MNLLLATCAHTEFSFHRFHGLHGFALRPFRVVQLNCRELQILQCPARRSRRPGQYRLNNQITINARNQNLLDRDVTSFQTTWTENSDGRWAPKFVDDYNNKDKARSYWLSVNVAF